MIKIKKAREGRRREKNDCRLALPVITLKVSISRWMMNLKCTTFRVQQHSAPYRQNEEEEEKKSRCEWKTQRSKMHNTKMECEMEYQKNNNYYYYSRACWIIVFVRGVWTQMAGTDCSSGSSNAINTTNSIFRLGCCALYSLLTIL